MTGSDGVTGYYLSANARGDGVCLSKDLSDASKWTLERMPRK